MREEKIVTDPAVCSIFVRSWRPETGAGAWSSSSTASTRTAATTCGWPSSSWRSGLAVYALDLRGRGQSDGERFYVEKIGGLRRRRCDALVTLAKSREPGLPVFLLGHSAGGVISCVYTLEHQAELAGLICESFAFQVPAPDFALAVIKGLSHLAPHAHVLKLHERGFSRDPGGRRGPERRSADRQRGAADAHRGRNGPRRRAAEAGVPAHHAAGAHPPRHRGQGHAGRKAASSSTTRPARRTRR